jgi:hypothetical protein
VDDGVKHTLSVDEGRQDCRMRPREDTANPPMPA